MKNNKKKSEPVMKLQNFDESKRLTMLNVQSRTSMKTTQRRRKGTFGITSTACFILFFFGLEADDHLRQIRNSEAEYLSELSASLSTGTTWERICSLVDLQNSQSKTIARTGAGTTDLVRFKEVLLRLKREGDAAPGAGGY